MEVLNPRLYRALEVKFGDVKVVNNGHAPRVTRVPAYRGGKARMSVHVDGGEAYVVRCPFCRDWRQRLQFNHLFGTRDHYTNQLLLHLVYCYNEDCLADHDQRRKLHESLMIRLQRCRGRSRSKAVAVRPGREPQATPRRIVLPAGCEPIHKLDACHPARKYLESRAFDVEELWRRWRVRYCRCGRDASPKIYKRLVIPVYRPRDRFAQDAEGKAPWMLAGWQARAIADTGGESFSKYLSATGMSRNCLLYGLPHACNGCGPLVVTEGPTDVWRLDHDAVATFGKSMSVIQENTILSLFEGRPIVVAYDRDAVKDRNKVVTRLRNGRRMIGDRAPVSIIRLPKARSDIGDCSRDEAWRCVVNSLK